MLFYSGDTDGAVPTYGSLQWIAQLGWEITEPWRVYMVDNQVGGYVEAFKGAEGGLTFGTVHGAGHIGGGRDKGMHRPSMKIDPTQEATCLGEGNYVEEDKGNEIL